MNKLRYVVFFCLFFTTVTQAQFLKKLGKKISEKVEETATENISDKAANETDETLNNAWETDLSKKNQTSNNSSNQNSSTEFPDSYNFDWKYSVRLDSQKGSIDFVYRLKEGENYMGMGGSMMKGMFMVMDFERDLSIMYMSGFVKGMPLKTPKASEKDYREMKDMTFEKIGSKTILGYQCDGYRAENDNYIMTLYLTDEAGIGFPKMYESQEYFPKGFDPDWINENSLMMGMEMVDKKSSKKNMSFVCTGIEKDNFTISK